MSNENPEVADEREDLTSVDIIHGEYQDAAPAEDENPKEEPAPSETHGEKSDESETDPEEPDAKKDQDAEGDEGGKDETGDDSTAKPKGAQKRIGKLTYEMREAQRERDYWRDQALEKQKQDSAGDPQPESNLPAPPTLESVEFDDAKYAQEMAKWAVSYADAREAQKAEAQQTAQKAQSEQARLESYAERADAFSETKDDYYDVAHDPDLQVSEAMREVILESDHGPQLLYHLGENPKESSRISRLSPVSAALELGKLEARLTAPSQSKTSSAPAPVKPVVKGAPAPASTDEHKFLGGATFD